MTTFGNVARDLPVGSVIRDGTVFGLERTGIPVDIHVTSYIPGSYAYIYRNSVPVALPIKSDGSGNIHFYGNDPSYSNPYTIYTAQPDTKLGTGEIWEAQVATDGTVTITQLFSIQRAIAAAFA